MNYKCSCVAYICCICCILQIVDKIKCSFFTSCPDCEDCTAFSLQQLLTKAVIRRIFKSRIVDFDSVLCFKELCKLKSVVTKTLHTKSECFKSDRVHKSIKRCKATAYVSPDTVSQLCNICKPTEFFVLCKTFVSFRIPFKIAAVNDYSAD